MVGVGIDGEIVHALGSGTAGADRVCFLSSAGCLSPWLGIIFMRSRWRWTGRWFSRMRPAVAFVGNVKEYGTGFEILPAARSDDELLDVCVLPAGSARELIGHFMAAFAGVAPARRRRGVCEGKAGERTVAGAGGGAGGWGPGGLYAGGD